MEGRVGHEASGGHMEKRGQPAARPPPWPNQNPWSLPPGGLGQRKHPSPSAIGVPWLRTPRQSTPPRGPENPCREGHRHL